jgi:DNA-directed RNA polymerase subunit RPC12/RpoP
VFVLAYKCAKCGDEIKEIYEGSIRCPSCGYKILYKTRDSLAKEVSAD